MLPLSPILCPHQELNLDLTLRTGLFYPLNYGGMGRKIRKSCSIQLSYRSMRRSIRKQLFPARTTDINLFNVQSGGHPLNYGGI